jgi:hypothetical protein
MKSSLSLSLSVAGTKNRINTADPDIMASDRRLTDRDISVVAGQLGVAWRVLGQRLNFTPETLDAIEQSTSGLTADSTHKQVRADGRVFSDGEATFALY